MVEPLKAAALYRACDPALLGFATTAELPATPVPVGQERAMEALRFGVKTLQKGFHVFVMGPPGVGKHGAVRQELERLCRDMKAPCDWVYVMNFKTPQKPRVLRLEAGSAAQLREGMSELIDDLKTAIPAVFETAEYRARLRAIDAEMQAVQDKALAELRQKANARGLVVIQGQQGGIGFTAVKNGEVVSSEAFSALPLEEKGAIMKAIDESQKDLADIVLQMPRAQKTRRDHIRALNRELAQRVVDQIGDDLEAKFAMSPAAYAFVQEVEADLVENVHAFLEHDQSQDPPPEGAAPQPRPQSNPFRRYEVNVLVANDPTQGAPIVAEPNPGLGNLVGRIDHVAQMGALLTDFTFIRPGALHRANGGVLMVDAAKVLTQPFAWAALKRAMRTGEIRIESPMDASALAVTMTLEPEPVPLELKVVLFGDREVYYMLAQADPDFPDLFKVVADFDETVARDAASERAVAGLVGAVAAGSGTLPLAAPAVARVLEEGSRLAGDAEKLLVMVGPIADLVREADHLARSAGGARIAAADIAAAVEARTRRAARLRERQYEAIARDFVRIETAGTVVGQINGLTVLQLPGFAFGRPVRITARVAPGKGEVVDIEREVALGGPLHAKGVLILQGYLSGRYAADSPLALKASLVFEQSYGGVDGDSASAAELLVLLSALAEVPLRQDLAITGSVDQLGRVQVIGGANEKIEGFFDICRARGLRPGQGVIIPEGNVKNLMLKEDVRAAAGAGAFAVYPVATVTQALGLLTGLDPARVEERVRARLAAFAEARLRDWGRD